MSRLVVISPHLDDAFFSVFGAMSRAVFYGHEVAIATPFGGQPEHEPHRSKYLRLHDEHRHACDSFGFEIVNGPFLDDAARGDDPVSVDELADWIADACADADEVWVPVGIHHPDHLLVAEAESTLPFRGLTLRYYSELPYRVLYPAENAQATEAMRPYVLPPLPTDVGGVDMAAVMGPVLDHLPLMKRLICSLYSSQVDDDLLDLLTEDEMLWEWPCRRS